jgi:hypothetical protein
VDADFISVLAFLKDCGIIPKSAPSVLIDSAKNIHRVTHSLILWRFRLTGVPEHGRAFVEEIASDALQILPQVLMGYSKTAKLLTRGIIENTLRHLYFSDHPVEFARMNRDAKWFMTIESLLEYARTHPVFLVSEKRFDALNRLGSLYSDLSAGVHGRTVQDLEMRIALNKIAYEERAAKQQVKLAERCAEAANFLLAMFHREKMSAFPTEDRRAILRTLPPRARQVWNESL